MCPLDPTLQNEIWINGYNLCMNDVTTTLQKQHQQSVISTSISHGRIMLMFYVASYYSTNIFHFNYPGAEVGFFDSTNRLLCLLCSWPLVSPDAMRSAFLFKTKVEVLDIIAQRIIFIYKLVPFSYSVGSINLCNFYMKSHGHLLMCQIESQISSWILMITSRCDSITRFNACFVIRKLRLHKRKLHVRTQSLKHLQPDNLLLLYASSTQGTKAICCW